MIDGLNGFREFANESIERYGRKEFERLMIDEVSREIAKHTRPDGSVDIEELIRRD